MPKLVPITHRELARKLRRAGYVEIRTSRHPVYWLAAKKLTIPVPSHPGACPKERSAPSCARWSLASKNSTRFKNEDSRLPQEQAKWDNPRR